MREQMDQSARINRLAREIDYYGKVRHLNVRAGREESRTAATMVIDYASGLMQTAQKKFGLQRPPRVLTDATYNATYRISPAIANAHRDKTANSWRYRT